MAREIEIVLFTPRADFADVVFDKAVGKQILIAKLMPIPVISEEEMRAAEAEVNLSNRQRKKQEKARSLHHIDDEEYADVVNRMEDRYEDKPAEQTESKAEGLIAPAPLKDDDRKQDKKKN